MSGRREEEKKMARERNDAIRSNETIYIFACKGNLVWIWVFSFAKKNDIFGSVESQQAQIRNKKKKKQQWNESSKSHFDLFIPPEKKTD